MKVALLCLIVVFGVVFADEKYTSKYDNINLDDILASDRLLKNYVNCLLEKGKCTPDGEELKKVLPDALETDCVKCSEKQKEGAKKVIRHLIKNQRQWWSELETKYDPDHKYVTKYRDELEKEGIKL